MITGGGSFTVTVEGEHRKILFDSGIANFADRRAGALERANTPRAHPEEDKVLQQEAAEPLRE